MAPRSQISPQLAALFVLLLGALVALPLVLFKSYEDTSAWVAHTSAVRLAIRGAESALYEAESAQRGYLLTGDHDYRDAYRRAVAILPDRLARLRTLTRENPAQQRELGDAEMLVDRRIAHLERLVGDRDRDRPIDETQVREGKEVTDSLAEHFGAMENLEQRLSDERTAHARFAGRVALLFTVLVSMGLAAVAGAIWLARQARRRAEEQRARFYSLLMQTPVPIAVLEGPELRFGLVNAACREVLGVRDFEGRRLFDVFPTLQGGEAERLLDEVARTGEPRTLVEHDLPTGVRKEPLRIFTTALRPLYDESGRLFAIMSVSIEVTEELAARRKIEAAVRLRDEFLSIASHELRTPLTTLRLQTDSLMRAAQRSGAPPIAPEQLLRKLTAMEGGVDRLEQLVSQLLDVTRIERGRLALYPEEVDLAQLAREAVERHAAEFSRLHRTLTLHAQAPIVGHWDKLRLDQVLTNLLTNALKYGGDQPVEVEVAAEDGVARLAVVDHGIGIAPSDQKRIFERFERAVDERHFGGLGLGLYITRRIVEAHHGAIHVDSAPGEGAQFIVELPLQAS